MRLSQVYHRHFPKQKLIVMMAFKVAMSRGQTRQEFDLPGLALSGLVGSYLPERTRAD